MGSTKLATEIFRVQDWKSVLEFIHAERMRLSEKGDRISKRIAKLTEEINWVTSQINEMQTKGDWSRRVVIDCEIAAPGTLELALAYNVRGAQWGPEYQIRYDTASAKVTPPQTVDTVIHERRRSGELGALFRARSR